MSGHNLTVVYVPIVDGENEPEWDACSWSDEKSTIAWGSPSIEKEQNEQRRAAGLPTIKYTEYAAITRCERCRNGEPDTLADGSPGICCRKSLLEDQPNGQRSRVWPVRPPHWYCADGEPYMSDSQDLREIALYRDALGVIANHPSISEGQEFTALLRAFDWVRKKAREALAKRRLARDGVIYAQICSSPKKQPEEPTEDPSATIVRLTFEREEMLGLLRATADWMFKPEGSRRSKTPHIDAYEYLRSIKEYP